MSWKYFNRPLLQEFYGIERNGEPGYEYETHPPTTRNINEYLIKVFTSHTTNRPPSGSWCTTTKWSLIFALFTHSTSTIYCQECPFTADQNTFHYFIDSPKGLNEINCACAHLSKKIPLNLHNCNTEILPRTGISGHRKLCSSWGARRELNTTFLWYIVTAKNLNWIRAEVTVRMR